MNPIAEFILLLLTLALMALPLLPTLSEWLRPTDDQPLAVDQNATHHLRHFADSLRHLMDAILGKAPTHQELQALGNSVVRGNTRISIFQDNAHDRNLATNVTLEAIGKQGRIAVFAAAGQIAPHCNTLADIYALSNMAIGSHVSLRSCCAKGDIHLANDVVVHRWMDAQNIVAEVNLTVNGRITALESIRFSDNNRFLRAGAPTLYFGAQAVRSGPARQLLPAASSATRFLHAGDATISGATERRGNFVVQGAAQVAANTDVGGSIKAHGTLQLHAGASVAGGLVAGKNMDIGAACTVLGPLICDEDIAIGPDCTIGTLLAPTTIVCRRLVIAQGVTIHGVVTTQDSARVAFGEANHAT